MLYPDLCNPEDIVSHQTQFLHTLSWDHPCADFGLNCPCGVTNCPVGGTSGILSNLRGCTGREKQFEIKSVHELHVSCLCLYKDKTAHVVFQYLMLTLTSDETFRMHPGFSDGMSWNVYEKWQRGFRTCVNTFDRKFVPWSVWTSLGSTNVEENWSCVFSKWGGFRKIHSSEHNSKKLKLVTYFSWKIEIGYLL